LKSRLTNYKNCNFDKIIITDPINYSNKYSKINVYNNKLNEPLQKIWLQLPKVKTFKPVFINIKKFNVKSLPMVTILSPLLGDIKKYFLFIKKLETHILTLINKKLNKNLKLKSCLKKKLNFNPTMTIQMPIKKIDDNCCEFLFHIYNFLNKRITPDLIETGTYISSFIELTEVWYSDTYVGFNWNILQMKLYPDFNFNQCLFFDETVDEDKTIIEECYHCLYCPNQHVRTHMCLNNNSNEINNNIHPHSQHSSHSSHSSNLPPPPPPPPSPPPILSKNNNSNNTEQNNSFSPSISDLLNIRLKPIIPTIKKELPKSSNGYAPSLDDILKAKEKLGQLGKKKSIEENKKKYKEINNYMKKTLLEVELKLLFSNRNDLDNKYKKFIYLLE
jgi:hypothetical protein